MTLQKSGGFAGLVCAATYLFGFAFLVTIMAPMGFGTVDIDGPAVVAFIQTQPGVLILWNTIIYIVNALALAVLVTALKDRLQDGTPDWATLTFGLGMIWAALVLAAGMIANVTVEQTAHLAQTDAQNAQRFWEMLRVVELGLGGGNEIAGGAWITCVSVAGLKGRSLRSLTCGAGLLSGLGGLFTLIPALGDSAGVVFGLGAIAWFILVGVDLLRGPISKDRGPTAPN